MSLNWCFRVSSRVCRPQSTWMCIRNSLGLEQTKRRGALIRYPQPVESENFAQRSRMVVPGKSHVDIPQPSRRSFCADHQTRVVVEQDLTRHRGAVARPFIEPLPSRADLAAFAGQIFESTSGSVSRDPAFNPSKDASARFFFTHPPRFPRGWTGFSGDAGLCFFIPGGLPVLCSFFIFGLSRMLFV